MEGSFYTLDSFVFSAFGSFVQLALKSLEGDIFMFDDEDDPTNIAHEEVELEGVEFVDIPMDEQGERFSLSDNGSEAIQGFWLNEEPRTTGGSACGFDKCFGASHSNNGRNQYLGNCIFRRARGHRSKKRSQERHRVPWPIEYLGNRRGRRRGGIVRIR